jgi:thioredoxin-related protein
MKKLLSITLALIFFTSCKNVGMEKTKNAEKNKFEELIGDHYELSKPTDTKAVLVLFGSYPEKAKDIRREFKILENAMENGIAVVYMNYNQKLWLEENENIKLAEQLQNIFEENNLPKTKTYLGGFSSGGNVALLISDFLTEQNFEMAPKGVFAVDSPIDLIALYKSSEKNVERNFSELSIQESTWLLETLGKKFGDPHNHISSYENYSIYTSETDNFDNIQNLKNVKIRLYSEPDTLWWQQNRMADFDQMNAYYLERLSKLLKKSSFKRVEYIATENQGYRANGERHPHSWSIVDKKGLIEWITE